MNAGKLLFILGATSLFLGITDAQILGDDLNILGDDEEDERAINLDNINPADVECPAERKWYLPKYISCVECRTSADCAEGFTCYIGECSEGCPNGMYLNYEELDEHYFLAFDQGLNTDTLWDAYADIGDSRKEIFDQITVFQENYDHNTINNKMMPVCRCNENDHFHKAVNSYTHGTVVGHPFSDVCACHSKTGFCIGGLTVKALGFEMGSSALVPNGKPANCWGITYTKRYTFIQFSAVALFIAIFSYRSSSNILYDFHRLNIWNIIGTWTFAIMFILDDPHLVGYNRFLGVGVFAHNAAEWNFMIRLWFGNSLVVRQIMSLWSVTYLAVMMILVAFLPLQEQLVIAGTLGAMLDVTFVLMSFPLFCLARENKRGLFFKGESFVTVILFLLAYIGHLVALDVIFTALSNGNVTLEAWFVFILATFVQFFLLQLFAYNQDRRAVCCGPYSMSSYQNVPTDDPFKYRLVESRGNSTTGNDSVVATAAINQGIVIRDANDGTIVYDYSIYPDGLNERAKGCKECSKVTEGCPGCNDCLKKRARCPFIIYITLGFIAALVVNLDLFVTGPETKGYDVFDTLEAGNCPSLYPMRANRKIPEWLEIAGGRGSAFYQEYASRVIVVGDEANAQAGIIVSILLLLALGIMVQIQTETGCCCNIRCCKACIEEDGKVSEQGTGRSDVELAERFSSDNELGDDDAGDKNGPAEA